MSIIETYPEGIYRKDKNGETILGKALSVFIHNGDYHLTDLKIFQDGKIDCWGGLIDFEEFKQKVASGWVRTTIPTGSSISIFPLGDFVLPSEINRVEESELIKEVQDVLNRLNGRSTTSEICYDLYETYQKYPTEENKIALREAYERIPKHNRHYVLGDMNLHDDPIIEIIYG